MGEEAKSRRRAMREQDEKEGTYVEVGAARGRPVRLFYKSHGAGPVKVLIVMGFVCTHHLWRDQVEFFKQRPEVQLVVFDNRGTGYSRYDRLNVSTSVFAQDTHELVAAHLGWKRFHLLGLSMGGMIALEFASAHPEMVLSLTLCVTHAGGRYALGVPAAGARIMLRMQLARSRADSVHLLMQLLYSPRLTREEYAAIYQWHFETFRFHGLWPTLAQQRAIATHYVSDARLRAIAAAGFPVLVMTGTEDTLVNPQNSRILADALGAELAVFEGAGHMIHTQDAPVFNRLFSEHVMAAENKE